jgi:hypothetical protein
MPVFLIAKILVHRPRREKITLCVVMGLGLVCTAAVVPKMIYAHEIRFLDRRKSWVADDVSWIISGVVLWTTIEMWLVFIVACLPPMKNKFESFLKSVGLVTVPDLDSGQVTFLSRVEL